MSWFRRMSSPRLSRVSSAGVRPVEGTACWESQWHAGAETDDDRSQVGQPRSTMLTSPLIEGDNVILVASFGGDDRHPMWYSNLAGQSRCRHRDEWLEQTMRARVAEDDESTRLWEALTANQASYAGYQRKTSRQIPVVVLDLASCCSQCGARIRGGRDGFGVESRWLPAQPVTKVVLGPHVHFGRTTQGLDGAGTDQHQNGLDGDREPAGVAQPATGSAGFGTAPGAGRRCSDHRSSARAR